MADIYKDAYGCCSRCITTSFCLDGGSYDSTDLQMPKSLKFRIVANPDFWGFGTLSENTLIEGWGRFDQGSFDFFDGFEEDHSAFKSCGQTVSGPFKNEQRPDVKYRSVYDPENGDLHYSYTGDGIIRGGAEAYLLDRPSSEPTDNSSCDTTNPTSVFKSNPADFGSYPKILFNSKIYKNVTGAWRIQECSGCYTTEITNDMRVSDCSGNPKQHIDGDEFFGTLYDPFQKRCLSSQFSAESGCKPDGTSPDEYAGSITGVIRDTGVSPFLQYHLLYGSTAASNLRNGQTLGVSGDTEGVVTIFDVVHYSGHTTAYAVGTYGTVNVSHTGTGGWLAFDTYDPETCCGGAAYGVDDNTYRLTNSPVYHIDIGRVFNNTKNKIFSNRIDRTYGGVVSTPVVPFGTTRRDCQYVIVNEDGEALLVESGAIYDTNLICKLGTWDAQADYIYKLNGEYSTASGEGAVALSTDSGFYPLKGKQLPYYGSFIDVDRWDYTTRQSDRGTREVNKNATCYTKRASLSVYPDCLTQYTEYTSCDPATKYTLANVPRFGLVYRGCDFNDPCSYDESGRPWTAGASGHPSNMQDLIRGFGGQEIQMYVNLGTARGAEIKREPCCCGPPGCPGTNPPEFVQIDSPVTFPCFPKFDLYPEQYGCQDPLWYIWVMDQLGLNTNPSGLCDDPYYSGCFVRQPYTTYGYIRNLCGKETNLRRGVIDSLSQKLHTGAYVDTSYADNTVEPMYVEFDIPPANCCSPTGYPVGGGTCDPLFDSSYIDTSGNLITGSGGYTYNVCNTGQKAYYWGLTDSDGRLAYPYFHTKPDTINVCGNPNTYVNFDTTGTLVNGWPTDAVPFLVEIDHDDHCVGCETTQMHTGDLTISMSSLDTKFAHGDLSPINDTAFTINGWNHCQYPGIALTPAYDPVTDTWDEDVCFTGDGLALAYGTAYTGETCSCVDGHSAIMRARVLVGTNVPIGYVTYASGNPLNSYVPFGACSANAGGLSPLYGRGITDEVLENHVVYFKASMGCTPDLYSDPWMGYTPPKFGANGLADIYKCGGCSTSFPAPNSTPDLDLDFWFVSEPYKEIFEGLSDKVIWNSVDFLKNGLTVTTHQVGGATYLEENKANPTYSCSGGVGYFTGGWAAAYTGAFDCNFIPCPNYDEGFIGADTELMVAVSNWTHGNTGVISVGANLVGCTGSKLYLYGCTPRSGYLRGDNQGGFFGECNTGWTAAATGQVNGCGPYFAHTFDISPTGALPFCTPMKQDITDALQGWVDSSGVNGQALVDLYYDCYEYDPAKCCLDTVGGSGHSRNRVEGGPTPSVGPLNCYCDGMENMEVAYELEWQTIFQDGSPSGTPHTGWFGDPKFLHGYMGGCDNFAVHFWSGENIPGFGNIGPLPLGEPIAIHYNDQDLVTQRLGGDTTYNEIYTEPACAYHTGPNKYSYIGAELFEPRRFDLIGAGLPHLNPDTCVAENAATTGNGRNDYYSTCGTPTPFSTYSGGIGSGIVVNRKACWPEIMTVHKIECVDSGYKLHVSREYFEHNRIWYDIRSGTEGPEATRRIGLIDGGADAYHHGQACDVQIGCELTGTPTETSDYYFALQMATPSDTVTPVYPQVCATGTEPYSMSVSGLLATTNDLDGSGCSAFPGISGDMFWNYYNLLYDAGVPSAIYISDAGSGVIEAQPDPDSMCNPAYPFNLTPGTPGLRNSGEPIFTSVAEMNRHHSCIQDHTRCGGDLWCNKEFFPRKSYNVNTRITKMAALSVCTQNSQFQNPVWYDGHTGATWDASPNKKVVNVTGPFLDACDDDVVVLLSSGMGIDDEFLFIPLENKTKTAPSFLTLMGIVHPGFKAGLDRKTCVYADSGECLDILPEHNNKTIKDITFAADEYGYYLDKVATSGDDNCLFSPFKIMMDVECCSDRVAHRGTSLPTNLNWVATVPATVCKGWVSNPACACEIQNGTTCQEYDTGPFLPGLGCLKVLHLTEIESLGNCYFNSCDSNEDGTINAPSGEYFGPVVIGGKYLIDPVSNDPDGLLTTITTNGVYSLVSAACDINCSYGSSGQHSYNYVIAGSGETFYSFDGKFYRKEVPLTDMDIFTYKGDKYRFCGNGPSHFLHVGNPNCCDQAGGILAISGGCDCVWTMCDDVINGIKLGPSGQFFNIDSGETCGTGILAHELFAEYDCPYAYGTAAGQGCPFPSRVLFNITEYI